MDPRYPIGKWIKPEIIDKDLVNQWIEDIKKLPIELGKILDNTLTKDLHKQYREGSWNLIQIIHHLADSHMNAYIRHKLCVTVDCPTINPYPEQIWAELEDVSILPIEVSLQILEGLHLRWFTFLKSLSDEDLMREFIHPDHGKRINLQESIGMYSWHGRHHLDHIKLALMS